MKTEMEAAVRITFNRKELANALKRVKPAARGKLPILGAVLIERSEGEGVATLRATDLDIGLGACLACDAGGEIAHAVEFKTLDAACKAGTALTVSLEIIQLSDETLRAKAEGMTALAWPVADFPPEKAREKERAFSHGFTCEKLRELLEYVHMAASADATRYQLNGIYIAENAGTAHLVATDGRRLIEARTGVQAVALTEAEKATEVKPLPARHGIVPSVAIDALLKAMPQRGPVHVSLDDDGRFAWFEWQGGAMETKLVQGNYPNYTQVLPKTEGKPSFDVNPRDFLTALKPHLINLATLSGKEREAASSVKLEFIGEEMRINGRIFSGKKDVPAVETGLVTTCKIAGNAFKDGAVIALNMGYLRHMFEGDVLPESVKVFYTDDLSPLVMKTGCGITHVAMPVRLT